ncbi:MAG TPA: PAC2 family protein [Tepidisphaeraceae bacterium]|jgi:proteasome assembly chaperone (PAC2) family protein
MASTHLHFLARPSLTDGTMLLALTGWMDGGHVSTGTVNGLMHGRAVAEIARIDPDPFYLYNFPGSMEVAAMFRPEVKYEDGLVKEFQLPQNVFHCDASANFVFFTGKEPNLRWQEFADCIFQVADEVNVSRIIFMGSFGGTVPHTREPRIFASVSHEHLRAPLKQQGFRLSDYSGPASFATMLLAQCDRHDIEMMSLVSEIPGYLQGVNPLSIEAVTRRLGAILNVPVQLDALRRASDEWEVQVTQAVEKDAELAETVRKLEEQYDNELIGEAEA